MVAMLAFGGTFAYFTATANDKSGSITTGIIHLESVNDTITFSKSNVLPKENLFTSDEGADIEYNADESTRAQIAFFIFTVTALGSDDSTTLTSPDITLTITSPTITGATKQVTVGSQTATRTALAVLIPAGTSSITMEGLNIAFDASANYDNGTDLPVLMGATLTVTIEAKSIQAVDDQGDITADRLTSEYAATLLATLEGELSN